MHAKLGGSRVGPSLRGAGRWPRRRLCQNWVSLFCELGKPFAVLIRLLYGLTRTHESLSQLSLRRHSPGMRGPPQESRSMSRSSPQITACKLPVRTSTSRLVTQALNYSTAPAVAIENPRGKVGETDFVSSKWFQSVHRVVGCNGESHLCTVRARDSQCASRILDRVRPLLCHRETFASPSAYRYVPRVTCQSNAIAGQLHRPGFYDYTPALPGASLATRRILPFLQNGL